MHTILHQFLRMLYPHADPAAVRREYGLPEQISLNVRLTEEGWFVATSPELPGLVTQARSQQELIAMVNDAALTYFDVPKRKADVVYDRLNLQGKVIHYQATLQPQAA